MARNSNGPELTFLFAADIARFEAGINRIIAQLGKVEASINRASAGFNKLGTSSGVAANDVNRLIASLNNNKRSLDANTEAAKRNSDAMAKLQASFEKGRGAADQSQKSIGGVVTGLRGLLAGYIGVDAVMRGGRAFIDNAVEVGRFEKVLETASGTQAAYAKNFQFLESVADEFRLNVIGLGKEFANLSVATRGTTLEGRETEKIFRATSMAASALQMSTDQTRLTFKAFTDMISKGVVSSEELKRQLGNHIPGAMALASRAYGVTTQQMQKMLEAGTIMTTDFLPKMAAEMEKTFGKGAQSGAESLGNNIEYAKGQLALFFAEFGKATGVADGMNDIARSIGDIANQARNAMNGPLGQMLKYLSTANSLTLGVLTGDLGRRAANGLVDDVRRKMPGYKAPDTRPVDESEAFYSNQLGKEVTAKIAADKAALEQAAEEKEKKRLEAAIKAGQKFESEYRAWAKDLADRIAEIDAQSQRKATEEWKNKTERPGFMTTVGPAFTSSGIKELPTGFGGAALNLQKQVQDLLTKNPVRLPVVLNLAEKDKQSNSEIAFLSNEIDSLEESLEAKLISIYGSIDEATKKGWGKVINSTKDGIARVRELMNAFKGIELNSDLAHTLQSGLANIGSTIMEYTGEAGVGLDGIESLQNRIGAVFGDLLIALGKAALAYAAAKTEILASLENPNPAVAAVAGALAIAAGSALKATVNKKSKEAAQRFWTGGIVDEPTGGVDRVHALLRPNEMVLNERQQNTLFRMLREGPGSMGSRGGMNNLAVTVNVVGRSRGMDMLWTQERAAKARSRNGGRK